MKEERKLYFKRRLKEICNEIIEMQIEENRGQKSEKISEFEENASNAIYHLEQCERVLGGNK